jgi:hypothetical protein
LPAHEKDRNAAILLAKNLMLAVALVQTICNQRQRALRLQKE